MIEAELLTKIVDAIKESQPETKVRLAGLFSRLMELYAAEEILEKSNLANNQTRGVKITNYTEAVSNIAAGNTEVTTAHLGNLQDFFSEEEIAQITPQKNKINNYWLESLKKVESIAELIQEADQPLLEKLTKIDLVLSATDNNYKVVFHFDENEYINNKSLTLEFILNKQEDCIKIVSETISWKEDKSLTEKTIKKTQTNKKTKKKREIEKKVSQESFFQIFKNRSEDDEEEEPEEEDDEDAIGMFYDVNSIGDSFTVFKYFVTKYHGASFFGATIPEYVFEEGDDLGEGEDDDEDEDDDEEEETKKPKGKKHVKAAGPAGADGKEECKKQ